MCKQEIDVPSWHCNIGCLRGAQVKSIVEVLHSGELTVLDCRVTNTSLGGYINRCTPLNLSWQLLQGGLRLAQRYVCGPGDPHPVMQLSNWVSCQGFPGAQDQSAGCIRCRTKVGWQEGLIRKL